jgi:hypothetical protein
MGSGAVIYVPSSIKIGSCVQKLKGGDIQTHGQQRNLIFFRNKGSRIKRKTHERTVEE